MAKKKRPNSSSVTKKAIADNAAQIADWAVQMLKAADQLRLKSKTVNMFVPGKLERTVFSILHTASPKVRHKMQQGETEFTAAEVCGMVTAVAEDLPNASPQEQVALLMSAKSLMDSMKQWLAEFVVEEMKGKKSKPSDAYQFKITLLESQPPIWRRIQVEDCTLDKLHEHIQTAMGWKNSHLNQFEIDGERYGDPELLDDGVGDMDVEDSTTTMLSEVLPRSGKRFRFVYEYDFGDGWQHEVLFEGCPEPEKAKKYPLCLEGERACPPEDIGGVGGYEHFLEVIADPSHEEHADMLQWIGGKFDAEKFDAKAATKAMKKGLPDWRNEDEDF